MATVQIRDVQTRRKLDMPGDVPILRVPWELSSTSGPCVYENGVVHYSDKTGDHLARTSRSQLGECHPGEIVLIQYEETTQQDPRLWWLCEVERVEGEQAAR